MSRNTRRGSQRHQNPIILSTDEDGKGGEALDTQAPVGYIKAPPRRPVTLPDGTQVTFPSRKAERTWLRLQIRKQK